MHETLLIAGGGIGGLAAALGAAHAGWRVTLLEQSARLEEVGAGIQLSPNIMHRLHGWQLQAALDGVIARPRALHVRRCADGQTLARMPLHPAMQARYGAGYATIHRADLQHILACQIEGMGGVCLELGQRAEGFSGAGEMATLQCAAGGTWRAAALVIADGVRGTLRPQCPGGEAAHFSGEYAWRALVPQAQLPHGLRTEDVTLWLGHGLHAVQYPVRRGEMQNLVIVATARLPALSQDAAPQQYLWLLLRAGCAHLRDLAGHVPGAAWRLWPLYTRRPVSGPQAMAQQRVAWLGDAAHPMLPFLAQGAGMAIEDAHALQGCLARRDLDIPLRLQRYAQMRWRRCARVQARAQRNAHIFHATGPLCWGRDAALRLLGARLLDQPWLYAG